MAEIQSTAGPRHVEFKVYVLESGASDGSSPEELTALLNDAWSIMSAVPVTQHGYSAVQYVLIRGVVEGEEPTTEEETAKG